MHKWPRSAKSGSESAEVHASRKIAVCTTRMEDCSMYYPGICKTAVVAENGRVL